MTPRSRRRLYFGIPLTALFLVTLATSLLIRGRDLRARLALVSPG
jgi:hypothetical protein